MHIFIYIYTHTHIHIYTHTLIHIYLYTYTYLHGCTYPYPFFVNIFSRTCTEFFTVTLCVYKCRWMFSCAGLRWRIRMKQWLRSERFSAINPYNPHTIQYDTNLLHLSLKHVPGEYPTESRHRLLGAQMVS